MKYLYTSIVILIAIFSLPNSANADSCPDGQTVTCYGAGKTPVCIVPFPPPQAYDSNTCSSGYQPTCSAGPLTQCNSAPAVVGTGACCVISGGGGTTCQDDITNCTGPGKQTKMQTCAQIAECKTGIVASPAVQTTQLQDDLKNKVIELPSALQISIPGLNFTKVNKVDEQGYLYIPWIAEYISAIYNFGIGIVSIIAVIMIIMQGVRIITSGGGEAQKDAYNKILQAFIGLAIAWGSFFILTTVNPDLTQFKPLKVQYVTPEPMPDYYANPDDAPDQSGGFDRQIPISDLQQYKGKGCGKNLVEIATVYKQQQICQGTNHCANFVSRVLSDSGCDSSLKSNGAGDLAKKLSAAGWKVVAGHDGLKAGDIAVWGDPSTLSGGHIGVLTGNAYRVIDSGWDMSSCWKNKSTIEAACGKFYPIGYEGTFPKDSPWINKYASDGPNTASWKVRSNYAACVAQNGGCAPVRGVIPESCNYCAKLGPITEFDNQAMSRQCIDDGKGWDPKSNKGWKYYLKNPTNN